MDVFVEQVVTRKRRGMYEALFYVCWVLLVLCALAGLSGLMNILYTSADGGLGFRPLAIGMAVVFLGAAFLLWRAGMRLRTEYDYSFTNGVVDVARVLNGRKRVYLTSFDVKDLRAAGEESSSAFQSCARQSGAQLHRWYLNKEAKKYFFFYDKKGGRHLTVLELNDEMAKAIFDRRFLTAEVWDGAYKSV